MMLRFSLFILLSVTVAFALSCQNAKPQKAPPKLAIDALEIDLGKMTAGEVKSTMIELRNVGEDTLHIVNISTSCGCTAVKKPKPFLLKGESDRIEVSFNSSNFHGEVSKQVVITTNDPEQKTASVTLKANIRNIIEIVSPRTPISLGNLPMGKKITIPLTLKNVDQSVVSITGIEHESNRVRLLSGSVKLHSEESREVKISFSPKRDGFLNETILLKTDHKAQTRVPVRVFYTGVIAQ